MRQKLLLLLCFGMFLLAGNAYGQDISVTGTVKNEKGGAIAGASIKIKGTNKGAIANSEGHFTLEATLGETLIVSAINYESKEILASSNMSVVLTEEKAELSDVVVTALGIKRQAKDLGYAETTIGNKTLVQGKAVNIQQALNGKVSGLNISTVNSGVFETAKINIRGIRSLTGNNSPMLVVDGAPTPLGYLSSIPPDDVQDITILKSAASAAIYGPDAVNGVIVITTKKGGDVPQITVTSSFQKTDISFFPKMQNKFGAGAGEATDAFGNYSYIPYENQQYGPAFDGTMQPIGPPLQDGLQQMGIYNNSHFDDKKKFWNSGYTLQNAVSISGKDFFVSAEDAKINGLVPDDVNRRTSLRFNGSKQYGKFSINYGLNYILQNYDVVNEAGFQNSFPGAYDGGLFFLVLQTPSNVPLLSYKDLNSTFGQYSNYYNEYAVNPYWLIKNIRQKGREDDFLGSLNASYEFFPWLKATAQVSTSLAFQSYKNTNAPIIVSDFALNNRNATQYSNQPGSVFDDANYNSRINFDYYFSGDHKINKDFKLKYILGGQIRENRSKEIGIQGNNLVVPYLYNISVRSGEAIPFAGNNTDFLSRSYSGYGSLSFNYKEWANIEFTGRNDWDSRLSKQNRSFFYPAVDAAVVLSDAIPSLKNGNIISYFKIRGAISKSGNVNLGTYALQSTYSQPTGFPYGTLGGATANGTYPEQGLKPEFVNTKEVGIDLAFLKDRISFGATYFNQNNTNQVLNIARSVTTGFTGQLANAADFRNYGVELDLGLTPLVNLGKGRIDFKINATYNNNKVTHTLGNAPIILTGNGNFIQNSVSSPTVNQIAQVGGPAFAFQTSDYARDSATGKVIVDPITGMPSQAESLISVGRSLPLWILGFSPSYTIGNFSVSMTWDYKGGNDFFSGLGSDEDFAGISARSAQYDRKRFVFPNSVYWNGSKYVPNTNIQVQDGNYGFWAQDVNTQIGTNYMASAAAWRLRELNISYNLPLKWFGRNSTVIKKFTVSLVGKNLLLLVPKSNQWGDPEFNYSSTGNTFGVASSFQSPASRLWGGSVSIQF